MILAALMIDSAQLWLPNPIWDIVTGANPALQACPGRSLPLFEGRSPLPVGVGRNAEGMTMP